MAPNPFLLAADDSPELRTLLHENSALASLQDEHGYTLVHAAASYNHLDLLRILVREYKVDVDIKDEDNETALFVVETTEAAKVLVEELGANHLHRGDLGLTAQEKIESEGDFPVVAEYLRSIGSANKDKQILASAAAIIPEAIPPPPDGMSLTIGTMDVAQDVPEQPDPEFRRRIEELAQRDDFNTPEGQAQLRNLVVDALSGDGFGDDRSVKPRQE